MPGIGGGPDVSELIIEDEVRLPRSFVAEELEPERSVPHSVPGGISLKKVAGLAAQVVLVGIPEVDFLQYNPHVARTKELSILNARRANQTLQACLNLLVHSEQLRERCAQIELDALSFQSIGLIAGTPHSVAYLQHLLEEKMIVKLVALDLDIWDLTSEVQELCRVHGIPQFALDDLPAFAKEGINWRPPLSTCTLHIL
eukprot:g5352.t1